jgi:hypothetical protein
MGVLVALALGVMLNSAASVLLWSSLRAQVDSNDQTTVAVCELRKDLQRRVKASTQFLAEHPDGIPGISAADIRTGIDNQSRTIVALRGLDCPKSSK